MKKIIMLAMILGAISTTVKAEEGQLSFIPKVSIGEKKVSIGEKDTAELNNKDIMGLEADLFYGVTNNLEMGINISWTPYDVDLSSDYAQNFDDYDDTLNLIGLMGIARYNFDINQEFKPYISAKGGLVYGEATFENGSAEGKIEGKWVAAISTGVEYNNINLELGYKVTEFEGSDNVGSSKETEKEDIVCVSLGYRFE